MNYGSDPADQVVRFTLEGTEVALKLSGLAAKNFALFAYAVLKDQKKTRGKTRLVRMLKEQRPLKFFKVPEEAIRDFAREARNHGLLYVPIRNRLHHDELEMVVFADDAAKVQRVLDNLNLDFVRAQAGETIAEPVPAQEASAPAVQAPEHENTGSQEISGNFTDGRGRESGEVTEKNPSAPSSSSRSRWPGLENSKRPSVRTALQEIRRQQTAKREKSVELEFQIPLPRGRKRRKNRAADCFPFVFRCAVAFRVLL